MSSTLPDHYATLGLDRRCTAEQIKTAYRVLAKRLHPDVAGTSPEALRRAQELNAAHEVLSDATKRRAYDRELSEQEKKPEAPRERIQRDIKQDVLLRIEEFFRGALLTVKVNDPGNPHGEETYQLDVPPDTAPGERFRLERGEPFEGGHVIVRVKARPDYRFKVRGSDLKCDLRISNQRATQGGTEMTPGGQGRLVKVHVPAGVKRGAVLKVAGEGLPKPRGGRGDLLVRVTYRPEVKVTRR